MEEGDEGFDAAEDFYDSKDDFGSHGVQEPGEPSGNRVAITLPRKRSLSIVVGRSEEGGRELEISVPRKRSVRLFFRSASLGPTDVSSDGVVEEDNKEREAKPDCNEQGTSAVQLPPRVELPHSQPAGRGVKRKLTAELPVKLEHWEDDSHGPEEVSETPGTDTERVIQEVASTEQRKDTEQVTKEKHLDNGEQAGDNAITTTIMGSNVAKHPENDRETCEATTGSSISDSNVSVAQKHAREVAEESSADGTSPQLSDEETTSEQEVALDDEEDMDDEEEELSTKAFAKFAACKDMLDFGKRPAKKTLKFSDDEDSSAELDTEEAPATKDTDEETTTPSEAPKKKTLRFADILETGRKPPTKTKKTIRFAEPDKNDTTDDKPKKSVRFSDDDDKPSPGRSRKYSLDAPVVTRKYVRFLLPSVDSRTGKTSMRVYFPAVKRKRRKTIKTATVDVYPDPPLSLVLYMMDTKRFSHMSGYRRRKACHILAWIVGVVSALGLAFCMVMLLIYFYLHPQLPEINMVDVKLSDISLWRFDADTLERQRLENLGQYFNYILFLEAGLVVRYHNVNKRLDIHNDYLKVTLFYRGTIWGTSYIRKNFLIARGNVTIMNYDFYVSRWLRLNVGYTLNKEFAVERISIVSELLLKGRMSGAGRLVTSRQFSVRVRCFLEIHASNDMIIYYDVVNTNHIEKEDCMLVGP